MSAIDDERSTRGMVQPGWLLPTFWAGEKTGKLNAWEDISLASAGKGSHMAVLRACVALKAFGVVGEFQMRCQALS